MLVDVERLDLGRAARLFVGKLVTREKKHCEALTRVLALEGDQARHRAYVSVAGNVNHEHDTPLETGEVHLLAGIVAGAQSKERVDVCHV